jgi:hypothetical protein
MVKEFIELYDKGLNYNFDTCRFRPSASFSSPFGIDNTFGVLRIHNAIDRGYSQKSIYDIYAPFNFEKVSYQNPYGSYGSLLFLPVKDADFELRIAHLTLADISSYYQGYIKTNTPFEIMAGDKIGEAGNLGLSAGTEIVKGKAGAHTHTEIVSSSLKSEILDHILEAKYPKEKIDLPYSNADISRFALKNKYSANACLNGYYREIEKRKIIFLNEYKCVRTDYHTGELKTFYNSQALFGF